MIGVLVVLLVLSVVTRQGSLFLLSLALLVAAGLSRLWERHCLTGIEYRRHLSRRQASFGEEIQLEIEIVNRKLLPLSWLEIEDEISQNLSPTRGRVYLSHKPGRALLANLLALRPYERVRRRYAIPCLSRGEHLLGPVRLRSGDLFGFVTCERTIELADTVVVYPRVVSLTQLGLPARQPLGNLRTRSWIFEDASRIAGAREYRPGDGLRRIHWPATAKTQQLQVKVYDATTSHKLAVFLNLDTREQVLWGYGYDPEVLELSITIAASVAKWGLEQDYQVGLYTNGMHRLSRADVAVDPGRGVGQLERILVALGRVQPIAVRPFEDVLSRTSHRLAFGTTVVLVTAALTSPVTATVRALRAHGHAVSVILTGRLGGTASLQGIMVRHVGPPESWRDMPVLSVAGDGPRSAKVS